MDWIAADRARLEQAAKLPVILDAAYDTLEHMLLAIEHEQDPGGGAFAAFVMSGAAAANARDAVAAAPSLPPAAASDALLPAGDAHAGGPAAAEEVAAALAGLSRLLASRLASAAAMPSGPGDQDACADAARHAADVCSLLGGAPGR
jgi:hypothetical protein